MRKRQCPSPRIFVSIRQCGGWPNSFKPVFTSSLNFSSVQKSASGIGLDTSDGVVIAAIRASCSLCAFSDACCAASICACSSMSDAKSTAWSASSSSSASKFIAVGVEVMAGCCSSAAAGSFSATGVGELVKSIVNGTGTKIQVLSTS